MQSLRGFTIGVKAGDACIDVLRQNGITTIREFESYEDVIRAAGEGTIKVFCVDMPPAVYYLYKFNMDDEFRYGFTLYSGDFHRAVKKGRTELLRTVEVGFSKIDPKKISTAEKKWLGTPLYNTKFRNIVFY